MKDVIKEAYKKVEDVMHKHISFGACDSEPDRELQFVIKCALTFKDYPFDQIVSQNRLELYSSVRGWQVAAAEIGEALKELSQTIRQHADEADKKELQRKLWRI